MTRRYATPLNLSSHRSLSTSALAVPQPNSPPRAHYPQTLSMPIAANGPQLAKTA